MLSPAWLKQSSSDVKEEKKVAWNREIWISYASKSLVLGNERWQDNEPLVLLGLVFPSKKSSEGRRSALFCQSDSDLLLIGAEEGRAREGGGFASYCTDI